MFHLNALEESFSVGATALVRQKQKSVRAAARVRQWYIPNKFPPIFDYIRYAVAQDNYLKIGIRWDGLWPTFYQFDESFSTLRVRPILDSVSHWNWPQKLLQGPSDCYRWWAECATWPSGEPSTGILQGFKYADVAPYLASLTCFYSHTQVMSGMWGKYCKIFPSDTVKDDVQFVMLGSYPTSVLWLVGCVCRYLLKICTDII